MTCVSNAALEQHKLEHKLLAKERPCLCGQKVCINNCATLSECEYEEFRKTREEWDIQDAFRLHNRYLVEQLKEAESKAEAYKYIAHSRPSTYELKQLQEKLEKAEANAEHWHTLYQAAWHREYQRNTQPVVVEGSSWFAWFLVGCAAGSITIGVLSWWM